MTAVVNSSPRSEVLFCGTTFFVAAAVTQFDITSGCRVVVGMGSVHLLRNVVSGLDNPAIFEPALTVNYATGFVRTGFGAFGNTASLQAFVGLGRRFTLVHFQLFADTLDSLHFGFVHLR